MIMTFSIHDAFKIGDEIKSNRDGKIGKVLSIKEYEIDFPYRVQYPDGYITLHNTNSCVLHKEAPQTQAFKLYDKVEIIDLVGVKGIVAYVEIEEGNETKYRIQNEEKTHFWYAYESQLKLVSNEQEEVKTFNEHNLKNQIFRLTQERDDAKNEVLELRKEIKQLKQEKEDFDVFVTFYNSDNTECFASFPKKSFSKGVSELVKHGATDLDFYKLQGELKVRTIKTYEIDE